MRAEIRLRKVPGFIERASLRPLWSKLGILRQPPALPFLAEGVEELRRFTEFETMIQNAASPWFIMSENKAGLIDCCLNFDRSEFFNMA